VGGKVRGKGVSGCSKARGVARQGWVPRQRGAARHGGGRKSNGGVQGKGL
jgi:hypothetical protein